MPGLAHDFASAANDINRTFGYNPASQIVTRTSSNEAYAWTGHGSGSTASTADGLNRVVTVSGAGVGYDAKGNLTADPTSGKSFTYSSENQLTGASGGVVVTYDPLGRLYQLSQGATVRRFLYAADESGISEAISEYNTAGGLTHAHAFGPGVDEPIVWWNFVAGNVVPLHADERGSIIAISDAGGNVTSINRYDEYGKPAATNTGQFQYTGQMWLPEIGLYHYKNRAYAPHLGRFLQTDPIGMQGGMNLYTYVGNDPVNFVDPLGLQAECPDNSDHPNCNITVYGRRIYRTTKDSIASGPDLSWLTFRKAFELLGLKFEVEDLSQSAAQSGCRTPRISAAEAAAARTGNRNAFWRSRLAAGDPLAATALGIVRDNTAGGRFANGLVSGSIERREGLAGRTIGFAAVQREVQRIGVELMQAHVAAVGRSNGNLSAAAIAQYHFDVFGNHGLPARTFGGAIFTGSQTEASLSSSGWRDCP